MKQISIYFGKQQDGFLGSTADIIALQSVEDEEANKLVKALTDKEVDWFGIKTSRGTKIIHLPNILWLDVNDVEEGNKNE